MKITGLSLLLFLTLLSAGCKKQETTPQAPNPANANSFTLKKDGVAYSAGQILVSSTGNGTYIGIQAHLNALQPNIQTYGMSLNKQVQPGTYNESNSPIDLSSICAFFHIYNESQVFTMDDGELTVITNDTVARQLVFDFEFELTETVGPATVSITEGHAVISY